MKPPSPPYNFDIQLAQGESGEARLDRFFSTWFQIQPATPEEQRQGIDRWFADRRRPRTLAVEYKTDHTAARTGNAFIETISVDSEQKAGWAFTSQADLVLYYVPGRDQVYVLRTTAVRSRLPFWLQACEVRQVPNDGYHTHGLLVPLDELAGCADKVLHCPG